MSEAQLVGGLDRLPWLTDEPKAASVPAGTRQLKRWAIVSVAIVAGVSFWLGSRSPTDDFAPARPSTTVALPEAHPVSRPEVPVAQAPRIEPAPVPDVAPAVPRDVPVAPPVKKVAIRGAARSAVPRPVRNSAPSAKPVPTALPMAWPSRVTIGANGRLVQIGAYGSPLQAKRGWSAMVRAYPAVAQLSAVVVESRNSKGHSFYRFQIGTTSQAHSEVLCQRMQAIDLSCAVVGLAWKAKVER